MSKPILTAFHSLTSITTSENRKRFHVFRLVVILLIVLTLGLLSSSQAAAGTSLDEYAGFYKPSRFIVGEAIQLPDSIPLEEIQIRIEKHSNSVVNTITKSTRTADIGKQFIPSLVNVDGAPLVETQVETFGCRIFTRTSKFDGAKVVMTFQEAFKLGCAIPFSKKISIITLSKGEFDGEILFTTADKRGKIAARYTFKRN